MQVERFDERHMVRERDGANFVVFIYEGGNSARMSWSVDSLLITEADLPSILRWLSANLPIDCCWSLGIVRDPAQPIQESDLDVQWVIGSDVLNMDPSDWSPEQQRTAEEMLARRHRVKLV